jgi:adenosylmethionine-8-amino-7-oxononanoate aminotransferase
MRMYHSDYIKLLRQLCDRFQVHLIADEIAVGFGRTGSFFACEQAQISPDIMCLSKGLTAGYLPLSAVLCSEDIYQCFYHDYASLKGFLHSHSYTGNALACRAALASLEIFAQNDVMQNNKKLAAMMHEVTKHFVEHPHVAEVRQTGMILAIELVKDKANKQPYPWQERRGLQVYQFGLQQGVLLRPLGDVVYFMPPYIIDEEQIQWLAQIAWQGIMHATKN